MGEMRCALCCIGSAAAGTVLNLTAMRARSAALSANTAKVWQGLGKGAAQKKTDGRSRQQKKAFKRQGETSRA
ncbi:MAG: hypothetical protein V4578_26275 [Pseudomonadota bacterium]